MCSNNTAIFRHIATYTIFHTRTLPKGRDRRLYNSCIVHKGLLPCAKKTQRTIPRSNYRSSDWKTKNKHHELNIKLVSKKTTCDTVAAREPRQRHSAIAPPPEYCKVFSDCKDFLQSAKLFSCQRTNQYIRSSGGGIIWLTS